MPFKTTPFEPVRAIPAEGVCRPPIVLTCLLAAAAVALAACGDRNKDKAASQTAAKVNKEEITVHQINYFLSQQRALPPEQAASSGRAVLERLIDQELVLQKAAEQKLDREPRVTQQMEATRRDVIVKAYVDKISQGAAKPSAAEVLAYYEAHPGLFKNRRIYNLQELSVDATPEQVPALRAALSAAKSPAEFAAFLKTNGYKYAGAEAVRSAEQLPLADVDKYAAMKDGQTIFNTRPGGVVVIALAQSRLQPVGEKQASIAIEQFLLNERRRKLVADDLASLRAAAKIDYIGQFQADAAASPYKAPSVPDSTPVTTLAPTLPASAVNAAPQVDVNRSSAEPAASMPSGDVLDKGLKGMK